MLHCLLGGRKKFSRPDLPFFRYDGGDGDLVPLYLVTQKGPEDEIFRIGTTAYGLQSVIEFSERSIEISKKNAHFTREVFMASRCILAK